MRPVRHTAILALATAAALGAAPAARAAAEEGEHAAAAANPMAFDLVPFIATLIVFGIVLWILSVKVWPKINGALEARDQKIREDIAEAERTRRQAESALQQYEKALAEARTEASRIIEEARQSQQKIAADMRAQTEKELADMRDAAKRDIESAKSAAINELHAHVADLSTDIAGKILGRELSTEDQKGLVERSLGQLETAGSTN